MIAASSNKRDIKSVQCWLSIAQVELQYPAAKDRPPMPPVSAAGAKPAVPSKSKRPCFCDVLACSLRPQAELRAWFDEQLGYQPVQQTRLPLNMPNVRSETAL